VVVLATVPVVMVLLLPDKAAKPIAGGLYLNVEYTFLRKLAPTIH
jgi:hypothetical protein